MAHPPPPKPAAATPETTEEHAAAALAAAKRIEGHADAWMKAQGETWWKGLHSAPEGRAEVPIGEPGSIPDEIQRALEGLYTAAGWSKAEVTLDEGEIVQGQWKEPEKHEHEASLVIGRLPGRGLVLVLTP